MVFLSPGFDFMTINGTQGTLLDLKWITNRHLLCSTGNCAQCYVIAWMGGEFWGEWVCVYVCLSPFTAHLKLSQCSCLENPMDRGAWRATVHGVAKNQTSLSMHGHHNIVHQLYSNTR